MLKLIKQYQQPNSTIMATKKFFSFLQSLLIFIFFSSFFFAPFVQAQQDSAQLENKVTSLLSDPGTIAGTTMLIKYKKDINIAKVENDINPQYSLLKTFDVEPDIVVTNEKTALVTYDSESDLGKGLRLALSNNDVEFAQPLYKYTSFNTYSPSQNPQFSSQWYLQDTPSGINLPGALGRIGAIKGVDCTTSQRCGGENTVKVAVIDSGLNISGTMPQLEIASDSIDTAKGGRFYYTNTNACPLGEFYISLNFGTVSSPIMVNFCFKTGEFGDDDGHGTSVASSIIMENNTVGGVGVAYNTTLLPIALNGSFTYNSFIVGEAVYYAVNNGAKVINLSIGTGADDPYLKQAINYAEGAGVTVVAASGNCGNKTAFTCGIGSNNTVQNPLIYPAEYSNVISVGAVNYSPTLAGITRSNYSSFGNSLDFVVGVGDGTSVPFGVGGFDNTNTYSTSYTGTSYSAPIASGVIALGYSINPNLDSGLVMQYLRRSAKDLSTTGKDTSTGFGLINASEFIRLVNESVEFSEYDFSGDGFQDLLFQHRRVGAVVNWSLDEKQVYSSGKLIYNPNTTALELVASSDLDGDGYTDLLVRNQWTQQLNIWFTKNGGIARGTVIPFKLDSNFRIVELFDVNFDGVDDVVFQNINNGNVFVWELTKDGNLKDAYTLFALNNGDWEVLFLEKSSTPNDYTAVIQNKKNSSIGVWGLQYRNLYFGRVYPFTIPREWKVVGLSNFDSDSNPDIILRNSTNGQTNAWYLNSAREIQGFGEVSNPNDPNWQIIGYVDYDNDAIKDIILQHSVTGQPALWILNNRGLKRGVIFTYLNANMQDWRVVKKT